MNRVASQYFPDTVCGVVQDGTDEVLHRCQFSWFCDGKPDEIDDAASWAEATELASQVYWGRAEDPSGGRLEEHTSELQSLMRISYAVFCLKKKQQETDYRVKTPKQVKN